MDLLGNNNIYEVIFTVLPVALYAWLIIKFSGNGMPNKKMSFMHLMLGVLSFAWVDLFHFVFPQWHLAIDVTFSLALMTIVQTGLLEESMKYGCYRIGEDFRKDVNPMESMLYMMLVGCGFAIVENILYIKMYGDSVILPRAFSVMVHMSCALIIGYFYNVRKLININKFLYRIFPLIGISIASVYHGMFNLNLLTPSPQTMLRLVLILIFGVFISCYVVEDMKNRIKNL